MGPRLPVKDGAGHDVTTGWRRVLVWCGRAGATASVKRRLRRRERAEADKQLREETHRWAALGVESLANTFARMGW